MGGDFQKSLHLFFSYGYYVFEDDVYVDPSGIPDGKPNHYNVSFSVLFAGPYGDMPEVMDKGLKCATALFSELCVGATCPPCVSAF